VVTNDALDYSRMRTGRCGGPAERHGDGHGRSCDIQKVTGGTGNDTADGRQWALDVVGGKRFPVETGAVNYYSV